MDIPFHQLENIQPNKIIKQKLLCEQEKTKPYSQNPILPNKSTLIFSQSHQKKTIFFKFSRIHYHYKLKFSTLFHATALYAKCINALQAKKQLFSKEYLSLVCMYLSMKFQQIYPLRLKIFSIYFKNCSIDPSVYRNYQRQILQLLDGNLGVTTTKEILDEYLSNQSKQKYFYAYYLLQISLLDQSIIQRYQMEEICQAIILIMSQSTQQGNKILKLQESKLQTITKCARLIATAKTRLKINQIQFVERKYSKDSYLCVSGKHIFMQNC